MTDFSETSKIIRVVFHFCLHQN